MASNFFQNLALWEKMTLIFTFFAGFIKVFINRRKLQKLANHVSQNTEVEGERETKIYLSADIERHGHNTVPFGIRAIESGIEVEGVWISRSNSPASHQSRTSSPGSLVFDNSKKIKSDSKASLLHPRPTRPTVRPSYASSTSSVTTGSDTVTAIVVAATNQSPSTYDVADHDFKRTSRKSFPREQVRGRSLPRDLSFLDEQIPVPATTGNERLQVPSSRGHGAGGSYRQSYVSLNDSDHSITTEKPHITLSSPELTGTTASPAQAHEDELDIVERHRLSQVASMGQLTPRSRESSFQNEIRDTRQCQPKTINDEYFGYRNPLDPGNESARILPTPNIAYQEEIQGFENDDTLVEDNGYEGVSNDPLTKTNDIGEFAKAMSKVVRKVNSGFEVMKSGSKDTKDSSIERNVQVDYRRISQELGDFLPHREPRKLRKKGRKN